MQLHRSKNSMTSKIPEIQKALKVINFLLKNKGFYSNSNSDTDHTIDYLISETLYSKAKIPAETERIGLWLGANIMVEYSFEEAKDLLSKNLSNAESNLKSIEEDISFLKDQITTSEVNIARIYNFRVRNQVKENEKKAEEQKAIAEEEEEEEEKV